jgi:hypothetical protein
VLKVDVFVRKNAASVEAIARTANIKYSKMYKQVSRTQIRLAISFWESILRTEAVLDCSKEVGVEVNPEKTKCMLVSRNQNIGQKTWHKDSEQVL